MDLICSADCTLSPMEQIIYDNCPSVNIRNVKPYKIVFLDCDQSNYTGLLDLTNLAQWTAVLATANPIRFGELSSYKMGQPETTKEVVSLCQASEQVTKKIQKIEFGSKFMDNTTYTDSDFVANFFRSVAGKTMIMLSCDGQFMMYRKSWTAGQNPGFGGLAGDAWYDTENVGNLQIGAEVFTDITDHAVSWIKLPIAVFNAIAG